MIAPPSAGPASHDDLEALIREARRRQLRRRLLGAAAVAIASAVGLSLGLGVPGTGSARHSGDGGSPASAVRRAEAEPRVQIADVGSGGGVTWAINSSGLWLTTDGGRTWQASTPPRIRALGAVDQRIQQVEFVDPLHGWLTAVDVWSGSSELDWTSDGGRTWHRARPPGCCGAVSFFTSTGGYLSDGRSLLVTKDGGRTWRGVSQAPFGLTELSFADARRGLALVSKPSRLFRTTNGGRRWTPVSVRGPSAPGPAWLLPRIASFGRRLVVASELVGSRVPGLIVYVSDDGGSTWTSRPAPSWWQPFLTGGGPTGYGDEQRFTAASPTAWFAAAGRRLVVTEDAGRSWRIVRPVGLPPRWVIGAIDFASARAGWAIFEGPGRNFLMRTRDGGVHWAPAGPRLHRHRTRG